MAKGAGTKKMVHHAPDTPFPCAWVTLHMLAKEVDEKHFANPVAQSKYVHLVYHFMDLFMCGPCRVHMDNYIRSHPLPTPRRESYNHRRYFKYMVDFHNFRNREDGKPEMDTEDMWKLYSYDSHGKDICPAGVNCSLTTPELTTTTRTGAPTTRLAASSPPGPSKNKPVNPFAVATGVSSAALVGVMIAAFASM